MPRSAPAFFAVLGLLATACSTGPDPAPISDQSPPDAVERAQEAQESTDEGSDRTIYATSQRQRTDTAPDDPSEQDAGPTDDDARPHLAFYIDHDKWQTPAGEPFDADSLQTLLQLSRSPLIIEVILAPDVEVDLDALLDQLDTSPQDHRLQIRRGDLPESPSPTSDDDGEYDE